MKGADQLQRLRQGTPSLGHLRRPIRDEHLDPRRYQAARVQVHCPAIDTHTRQLILEQAMIYADGWARWVEEGHVHVGYVQTGPCCAPPEVSPL